jgi:4-hydroxy-tetrahydrodipicolinate reductase
VTQHDHELGAVGLFGRGRLGSAIAEALGAGMAWQVGREAPPDVAVDVAIEASSGAAVRARVDWALLRGVPLVIGSTGWELPELQDMVGDRIGVVVAPNFSLTVALLRRLCTVFGRFAALDPATDPYLFEHHHARKKDAPSGTAKLLAQALIDACPRKRRWQVDGPVHDDTLSIGVLRAGSTYSSHTVGLDRPSEVRELHHASRDASAYAAGALAAARWIRHRKGVHPFDAVAADVLDPLFTGLDGRLATCQP